MNAHEIVSNDGANGHLDQPTPYAKILGHEAKGMNFEPSRRLNIPSSLLFSDATGTDWSGSDDAACFNKLKMNLFRNVRNITGFEQSQTRNSGRTRKRQRESFDIDRDCNHENVLFHLPKMPSNESRRNERRHTICLPHFTPSKEKRTKMFMSTNTSSTSLCSTVASSVSYDQHDYSAPLKNEYHSYSTCYRNDKNGAKKFLVETIRNRFQVMLKDSRLQPNMATVQSLQSHDVMQSCSSFLGEGTFSRVTRVVIRGKDTRNENKQYACKQLKKELLADLEEFFKAATELAYEAHILSCLDHPNIVKLQGMAADGMASFGNCTDDETQDDLHAVPCNPTSFFLVMDVLQETLDKRIERWNESPARDLFEIHQRTMEKISLYHQLASVLEYIHSKGIVYRDLKPQNVGFCQDGGNLKLFDFGLAKELPLSIVDTFDIRDVKNPNEHMRFQLSGVVGTVRYMAPEVCLSQPYNRDCDIYSWSIVAWEIWTQTKPFEMFTPDLYATFVCRQGLRPPDVQIKNNQKVDIPPQLENLLKEAWKPEPHLRIRWQEIQNQLDQFQKSEELNRQQLVEEMATASTCHVTSIDQYFANTSRMSLHNSPIPKSPGTIDLSSKNPWNISNDIGIHRTIDRPIDRTIDVGKYPGITALPHLHHPVTPDIPSTLQNLHPPVEFPTIRADALDLCSYMLGDRSSLGACPTQG